MGLNIQIIGYVYNEWNQAEPFQAGNIMQTVSTIEVKEEFSGALFKIEKFMELNIIWYFHRSNGYDLQTTTRSGEYRGVFASCSPRRPSAIGLTRVKLLDRNGNILKVSGLDALNGTPVLDIKPYVEPDSAFKDTQGK